MLEPPKPSDLTSRMDPTKLRNRKFNTGMGARAPPRTSTGDSAVWTETAEQKRQRLTDEVMGVKKPAAEVGLDPRPVRTTAKDRETSKHIKEYNVRRASAMDALPVCRSPLKACRNDIDSVRCITNVKPRGRRKRATIPARELSIKKRISEEVVKSITRQGKSSSTEPLTLDLDSPVAVISEDSHLQASYRIRTDDRGRRQVWE